MLNSHIQISIFKSIVFQRKKKEKKQKQNKKKYKMSKIFSVIFVGNALQTCTNKKKRA